MAIEHNSRLAALVEAPVVATHDSIVVDCTDVPRFGLRGKGSYDWLAAHGIAVPDQVNTATVDSNGILVFRLGQNDIAISGSGQGATGVAGTPAAWNAAKGDKGYDGFRHDSWAHVLISGRDAPALMGELTDVDLRDKSLPLYAIAQTRALHVDTIVVRTDFAGVPGYELFFDLASRAFVLESLHHLARDYRFLAH